MYMYICMGLHTFARDLHLCMHVGTCVTRACACVHVFTQVCDSGVQGCGV